MGQHAQLCHDLSRFASFGAEIDRVTLDMERIMESTRKLENDVGYWCCWNGAGGLV